MKNTRPGCLAAIASKMKLLSSLTALALFFTPVILQGAEEPEDKFLKIFSIIDKADTLNASGNASQAKARYQEAQQALLTLKKYHPTWNTKVVAYRLKYVGEKIDALSKPLPSAEVAKATGGNTKSESKSSDAVSCTEVKLLDAGGEPRRALRIQAKPGAKQTLGMTLRMAMNMETAGLPPQAVNLPPMKMEIEATVREISPSGDITYDTVIGDASVADDPAVMPQIVEAMKASFGAFKGVSGTGTVTSRGLSRNTHLKLPPDTDPQTRQTMEQMHESFSRICTGLPEEPVGTGARWEVRMPVHSQGMTITQTTTYELASVESENLDLKSAFVQHAANQKIENPAMPGLNVNVTKMTGRGTGNVTINLTHVLPAHATMDSKSELNMSMDVGGQVQTMAMKMDMNLGLKSK